MNNNNTDSTNGTSGYKAAPMDANFILITNYLRGYMPTAEYGPGVTVVTTDEIIAALADMAELEQSDVNNILVACGYSPGRNDTGSFGWLMKTRDL